MTTAGSPDRDPAGALRGVSQAGVYTGAGSVEVSERKDEGVCAREHAAALLWSGRRGSALSRPLRPEGEQAPGARQRPARGPGASVFYHPLT